MATIYRVVHLQSGREYYGMTASRVQDRWNQHWSASKRNVTNNYFHHALQKYGREAFLCEPVCSVLRDVDAGDIEREIISDRGSAYPAGFNMRSGGERTYAWHAESKFKASRNTKSLMRSESARANLRGKANAWFANPENRNKHRGAIKVHDLDTLRRGQTLAAEAKRRKRWHAVLHGTATKYQTAFVGREFAALRGRIE